MMETTGPLYEVLYVSVLAPKAPISTIAGIAAKARVANQAFGITGLLIFDGMRFCQQLEGERKIVLKRMARIEADTRHDDVQVLHHGPLAERRFRSFSLGYVSVDDEDVLGQLAQLDGKAAVNAFVALLSTLDIVA